MPKLLAAPDAVLSFARLYDGQTDRSAVAHLLGAGFSLTGADCVPLSSPWLLDHGDLLFGRR